MAVTESRDWDWPQRRRVMKTTCTDRTVEQLIPLPNRAVLKSRRLRCAPPHGAARAALWLEAPRARARQLEARSRLTRWLIPASRLSSVARNPSRALRVATRWPAAKLRD